MCVQRESHLIRCKGRIRAVGRFNRLNSSSNKHGKHNHPWLITRVAGVDILHNHSGNRFKNIWPNKILSLYHTVHTI